MKKLSEKIGVGVLVAGLVMGGLGLFGGSVAHASSAGAQEKVEDSQEIEDLDLDLGEISEEEFMKKFEEMLKSKPVKKEIDDHGRKIYKVSFEGLNL